MVSESTIEPAPRGRPDGRLRIHVQHSAGSLDLFQVTPARFEAALAGHAALRERIAVGFGADAGDLDRGLRDAEVLLGGNFDAQDLRRRAPGLRWVQSVFAGVEKLVSSIPRDVTLTNGSGVHAPKAGEFAITALLMLNSAMPAFIAQQHRQRWEPIFTPLLAARTVLIVGVGNLGQAVAERARQFGMTVLGVVRSGGERPVFGATHAADALPRLLPGTDFLVVTLPNAPAARGLIGRRELDLLPRTAGVVSIGRAQAIDNAALFDKLRRGELAGAVLDVFEQEPLPPASPVWSVPNLIITPHCAVDDLTTYLPRALDIFFDNVERYLAGRPLRNVVDLALGY